VAAVIPAAVVADIPEAAEAIPEAAVVDIPAEVSQEDKAVTKKPDLSRRMTSTS
jgi:hypothetical protein